MNGIDMTPIAWAAGFFDGEGCIHKLENKYIKISVGQVVQEPLGKLQEVFFGGVIRQRKKTKENHQSFYVYRLNGQKAILALKLMLPYLTVKRQKAIEAINMYLDIRQWQRQIDRLP